MEADHGLYVQKRLHVSACTHMRTIYSTLQPVLGTKDNSDRLNILWSKTPWKDLTNILCSWVDITSDLACFRVSHKLPCCLPYNKCKKQTERLPKLNEYAFNRYSVLFVRTFLEEGGKSPLVSLLLRMSSVFGVCSMAQ